MMSEERRVKLLDKLKELEKTGAVLKKPETRAVIEDLFFADREIISDLLQSAGAEPGLSTKTLVRRAIQRLESLDPPASEAFDDLIERRIDAVLEKRTTLKVVRNVASVMTMVGLLGAGTLGIGAGYLVVKGAHDGLSNQIGEVTQKAAAAKNTIDASLQQVEAQVTNLGGVVRQRAEDQVSKIVAEFSQRLNKTDIEIRALDASVAEVRRSADSFTKQVDSEIQSATAAVKTRVKTLDEETVTPRITEIAGRIDDVEQRLKERTVELDAEVEKLGNAIVEFRSRADKAVSDALVSLSSILGGRTPSALAELEALISGEKSKGLEALEARQTEGVKGLETLIGERLDSVSSAWAAELSRLEGHRQAILADWQLLERQVSDSAAGTRAAIEKAYSDQLGPAPGIVAGLNESVATMRLGVDELNPRIDGLETRVDELSASIRTLDQVEALAANSQIISLPTARVGLRLVRDTALYSSAALIASVLASILIPWGIARRRTGSGSSGLAPPNG